MSTMFNEIVTARLLLFAYGLVNQGGYDHRAEVLRGPIGDCVRSVSRPRVEFDDFCSPFFFSKFGEVVSAEASSRKRFSSAMDFSELPKSPLLAP